MAKGTMNESHIGWKNGAALTSHKYRNERHLSETYPQYFTSNRVINSHAFSLDSQHGTATTISMIVITQAGNSPFNHDLYHTEGFVFSSAKSKEKTKSH